MNFGLYVNELKNDDSVRIVVMHHMMTGLVSMTYNGSSITESLKEIMINAVATDWFPYSPELINDEDCLHFKFYEMDNNGKQVKDSYYDIFIDGYYGFHEDDNDKEIIDVFNPDFIDETVQLLNVNDFNEIYNHIIPKTKKTWWLRPVEESDYFAYVDHKNFLYDHSTAGSRGVRPILNYYSISDYIEFTNEYRHEFYFNNTLFIVINLVDNIAISNESLCEMEYDANKIRSFLHDWFKEGLQQAINDLKEGEE